MANVFISYTRASQDVIEQLVRDLRHDDHETWFDQQLEGGQPWWDKILSEIRKCEIFVSALTPESLESQACTRELRYARDLQKPLLPIRLSDVQPRSLPPELCDLQLVDYIRHQDKQTFQTLQRALKKLPKAPPPPDPLPELPAIPVSYMISLRKHIETESDLDHDEQIKLAFRLKKHRREGRPTEEIADLVHRLKKRDDLHADVQLELDELLAAINPGQPPASRKALIIADDMAAGDVRDQAPASGSEDGTERHLKLDCAVEECRCLMERVLKQSECWVFEFDPANSVTIEFDASAVSPCIMARASLRDTVGGAKAKELKALGWQVSDASFIKASAAAAALYLTSGLAAAALLSRGVRDILMAFEGTRSWIVTGPKDPLTGPAAEFALALQRIAPDVKTIIVKRRGAQPQE